MTTAEASVHARPAADEPGRLATFDGLRGLAALAVFLFHLAPLLGVQAAPGGYLAVDLFFALSGYVVASAYGARLAAGLGAGAFMLMRIVRFYPVYIVGTVIGLAPALASAHSHGSPIGPILLEFGLACAFLPSGMQNLYPLNVPAWTLGLELLVNGAYAAVLRRLPSLVLAVVAVAAFVALAAGVLAHGDASLGTRPQEAVFGALRTVVSFVAGMLIYRCQPRFRAPAWLPLAGLALLLVPAPHPWRAWLDLAFIGLVSPTLIALAAPSEPVRLRRPMLVLGAMSYPLYAIHYPMISLGQGLASAAHLPGPLVGAAVLVAAPILAFGLSRWFEAPARRWLLTRLRLLRAAPAPRLTGEPG